MHREAEVFTRDHQHYPLCPHHLECKDCRGKKSEIKPERKWGQRVEACHSADTPATLLSDSPTYPGGSLLMTSSVFSTVPFQQSLTWLSNLKFSNFQAPSYPPSLLYFAVYQVSLHLTCLRTLIHFYIVLSIPFRTKVPTSSV